jgi:EAL domain-containing protein (putative c-di-GMP-specific phosphodiesterase class I)/ActR/RegA family two-component response regulator
MSLCANPQTTASAAAAPPTSPPAPPANQEMRSEPRTAAAPRGRVLIVDDDPAQIRTIGRVLRLHGYEVESAGNGAEASRVLRPDAFDVILSDIAMPGMDGIQLLKFVRDRNLDVPVVLITGEPAVSTAVKALEFGAFHYLTKPVELPDLEVVIDKAVCVHRMTMMKRQAAELLGNPIEQDDTKRLAAKFDRALESMWVAYQPIVSATTKQIFGYEALLRSTEPSLPHPGAVLDAAERLGRLEVLGRTIRDLAAEPVSGREDVGLLFVNLHTTDLLDPELLSKDAPLSRIAHRVVLEITERASLEKVKDVRSRIATLREMGFRIAVDDLGAGYAGLTSFVLLEPEIVKLDMTLIRDVHQSATKQKLIRSMTGLCKDMGMLVVGEGVETVEERDSLIDLRCDLLQGYLFAKPGKAFPKILV